MASRVLTEEEKIAEWEERKREKENAMVSLNMFSVLWIFRIGVKKLEVFIQTHSWRNTQAKGSILALKPIDHQKYYVVAKQTLYY